MLPAIITLWALLARVRPQEIIVAERLRFFFVIAMVCAAITTIGLVGELLWRDAGTLLQWLLRAFWDAGRASDPLG